MSEQLPNDAGNPNMTYDELYGAYLRALEQYQNLLSQYVPDHTTLEAKPLDQPPPSKERIIKRKLERASSIAREQLIDGINEEATANKNDLDAIAKILKSTTQAYPGKDKLGNSMPENVRVVVRPNLEDCHVYVDGKELNCVSGIWVSIDADDWIGDGKPTVMMKMTVVDGVDIDIDPRCIELSGVTELLEHYTKFLGNVGYGND